MGHGNSRRKVGATEGPLGLKYERGSHEERRGGRDGDTGIESSIQVSNGKKTVSSFDRVESPHQTSRGTSPDLRARAFPRLLCTALSSPRRACQQRRSPTRRMKRTAMPSYDFVSAPR